MSEGLSAQELDRIRALVARSAIQFGEPELDTLREIASAFPALLAEVTRLQTENDSARAQLHAWRTGAAASLIVERDEALQERDQLRTALAALYETEDAYGRARHNANAATCTRLWDAFQAARLDARALLGEG